MERIGKIYEKNIKNDIQLKYYFNSILYSYPHITI